MQNRVLIYLPHHSSLTGTSADYLVESMRRAVEARGDLVVEMVAVIAEDSQQAEEFLHRTGWQIGSGHHRDLINGAEMSDEALNPALCFGRVPATISTTRSPRASTARLMLSRESAEVPVRLEKRGR